MAKTRSTIFTDGSRKPQARPSKILLPDGRQVEPDLHCADSIYASEHFKQTYHLQTVQLFNVQNIHRNLTDYTGNRTIPPSGGF